MNPKLRTVAVATLATGVVATLGVATAGAGPVNAAPIAVSGASPFTPGCNGAPQTGTNFPGSEVEPQLAINPTDPSNIIGAYQQDRWSDGGSNSDVASVTHDGGKTWKQVVVPHITHCAGGTAGSTGDYERSTDPWVTYSPDGTLYLVNQPFNSSNADNGMAVSTSHDGGDTWTDPQTLIRDTAGTTLNDKVSITADPTDSNYVYATWDRLVFPQVQASAAAANKAHAYKGPSLLSVTADHGKTWNTSTIYDPGQNNQTIGNQIVVLPDGSLLDFFDLIYNFNNSGGLKGENEALIRSTDHGKTWSQPTIISKALGVNVTDPNTGQGVRSGGTIPEVARDPNTGALYVVWEDGASTGGSVAQVVLSKSTDNGATWSAPSVVSTVHTAQSFTPSVRVNSNGTVAVTYYDFRNLAAGNTATLPTDYWAETSTDGGKTFTESHVAGSFDLEVAPNAEGLFLGDYQGLQASGTSFRTLFSGAVSKTNPTDIFTSTLG